MSKCTSMRHFAVAIGAASIALLLSAPVMAQTAQHPATSAPPPAAATTTPAMPSMPMQQMEHGGHGMGMQGGQGHQGMTGGQGQSGMPMGSMPQCPPGQTASGNPPTCR